MLNSKSILEYLQREGFEEVDEIEYKEGLLVYNFFYAFDETELEGAKDYANENYSEENGEDEWYDEYFLPFLTDVAGDNIREILDDICEEFEITGEFVMYEADRQSYEQCEVTMVLSKLGKEFDIDQILEDLQL